MEEKSGGHVNYLIYEVHRADDIYGWKYELKGQKMEDRIEPKLKEHDYVWGFETWKKVLARHEISWCVRSVSWENLGNSQNHLVPVNIAMWGGSLVLFSQYSRGTCSPGSSQQCCFTAIFFNLCMLEIRESFVSLSSHGSPPHTKRKGGPIKNLKKSDMSIYACKLLISQTCILWHEPLLSRTSHFIPPRTAHPLRPI